MADDPRRLASRAYYDLGENAQEALALKQLYKMLSFEVKYECIKAKCSTLYEAVVIIEQYEAIMGDKKKQVRATNPAPEKDINQELLHRLAMLEQAVQGQKDNAQQGGVRQSGNRQASANQQSAPRACYRCKSPDHMVRDCPIPPTCYICGSREHTRRNCPQNVPSGGQGNEQPPTN